MVDETEVKVAAVAIEGLAAVAATVAPGAGTAVAGGVAAVAVAAGNDPADVVKVVTDVEHVIKPPVNTSRIEALESLTADITAFLVHTFPNHFKPST